MKQNQKGPSKLTSVFVIVGNTSARLLIRKTIESMPQFILLGDAADQLEAARKWSVLPQLMLVDAKFVEPRGQMRAAGPRLVLVGDANYPAATAYRIGAIGFLTVPVERTALKESLQRICPQC